jgi:hypothetical protein
MFARHRVMAPHQAAGSPLTEVSTRRSMDVEEPDPIASEPRSLQLIVKEALATASSHPFGKIPHHSQNKLGPEKLGQCRTKLAEVLSNAQQTTNPTQPDKAREWTAFSSHLYEVHPHKINSCQVKPGDVFDPETSIVAVLTTWPRYSNRSNAHSLEEHRRRTQSEPPSANPRSDFATMPRKTVADTVSYTIAGAFLLDSELALPKPCLVMDAHVSGGDMDKDA